MQRFTRSIPSALIALCVLSTACADEPMGPAPGPDLAQVTGAFLLNIDVVTGTVTAAMPSRTGQGGAQFSLIGDEAIRLHTTNCTWTEVSKKLRRCSFDLAIENLMRSVDLVTPTRFPIPPRDARGESLDGIFVIPFTSAALGVTGSVAVPSPDWDVPAWNFFNDFATCQSGRTSDCYPSKMFASPLAAGQTSQPARVGFDVDRSAQSVAVYIVVAADLHDRGTETGSGSIVLTATECKGIFHEAGAHGQPDSYSLLADGLPIVFRSNITIPQEGPDVSQMRSFCSFTLPSELADADIISARLRFFQQSVDYEAYESWDAVIAESVNYGFTLETTDYDTPTLTSLPTPLSTDGVLEYKQVEAALAVAGDLAAGRQRSQFRLRFSDTGTGYGLAQVVFSPLASLNPPQLVIVYRMN